MCTHRKYIRNKYTGKQLLVDCGKCDACLQAKANKRSMRMIQGKTDGYVSLLVTFTYDTKYIPYVSLTDLITYSAGLDDESYASVPIYRDNDCKYVREGNSYDYVRKDYPCDKKQIILHHKTYDEGIEFQFKVKDLHDAIKKSPIKTICERVDFNGKKVFSVDKIGVLYHHDIANFFKRYKKLLAKKYHVPHEFDYFYCSEYGPQTLRPHFHSIFRVPAAQVQIYKKAYYESWRYCDYDKLSAEQREKCCQVAKSAECYVSTYVNSHAYIPDFLRNSSQKTTSRFSRYFGLVNKTFSLENVVRLYDTGSVRYATVSKKNGVPTQSNNALPQYVIDRYFPKFKGYSRLTDNEISDFVAQPLRNFRRLAAKTGWSENDLISIMATLNKRIQLAAIQGIDLTYYSFLYPRVRALHKSNVLQDWYESLGNVTYVQQLEYDNIGDVMYGVLRAPTLHNIIGNSDITSYSSHYNKLPYVVSRTNVLLMQYQKSDKSKKCKHYTRYKHNIINL